MARQRKLIVKASSWRLGVVIGGRGKDSGMRFEKLSDARAHAARRKYGITVKFG